MHHITYAGRELPTFSYDRRTARRALRLIERQSIRDAHLQTGIPRGILQGWADALDGDPPERPSSAPLSERQRAIATKHRRRERDITYSQPTAQQA